MIDQEDTQFPTEHIALLLRDVTLAYHRYTAFASRQRGAGVTELLALGYLRDKGPMKASELGALLGLTSPSVTALLDRLEKLGYAHRQAHPHDRRSLLIELTPSGRSEVGTLFELVTSDVNAALEGMSPAEQEAIVRFLGVMTSCFDQRAMATMVTPSVDSS